jgi:serine phosphatase RsbU (regulator of sigma subunit)/anti-anti-sigma regulatory factor
LSAKHPETEPTPALLIVDDDEAIRKLMVLALREELELEIEAVGSAREARERLTERCFAVVITDMRMPEEDGISLMQWAKESFPGPIWIVLTGHGTLDSAVSALQLGAFDFIAKPLSMATLRNSVRNALHQHRLRAERDRLQAELEESNERLREHVTQLEGACRLLDEQAETIRADLRRAALIQRALLPQAAPGTPGLNVQALYRPSEIVGGDLYDVVRLDSRRLVLMIADAAGHGLSAAMLAVLFRHRLPLADASSGEACAPSEALQAVNRSLSRAITAPGLFITAAYCLLDMADGKLSVASAGHPPLIVKRKSGGIERIFHTGPALGLYPDALFGQQETVLDAGDRLVLHTDGLYDRLRGEPGTPSETVVRALEGSGEDGGTLLQQLARLTDLSRDGAEEALSDDVTVLTVSAAPGPSTLDNGVPVPVPAPSTVAVDEGVEILAGGDRQRTTLSIRGRAKWTESAAFHEACAGALETGGAVTLDLTLCEHLDSTFLGTIHELVERADRRDVELRLQGVMPPVEELFREVGMKRVMEHIVPVMLPLPSQMSPLRGGDQELRSQTLRILKAHEGLAALSERNRREFDPLIEELRKEIDG